MPVLAFAMLINQCSVFELAHIPRVRGRAPPPLLESWSHGSLLAGCTPSIARLTAVRKVTDRLFFFAESFLD